MSASSPVIVTPARVPTRALPGHATHDQRSEGQRPEQGEQPVQVGRCTHPPDDPVRPVREYPLLAPGRPVLPPVRIPALDREAAPADHQEYGQPPDLYEDRTDREHAGERGDRHDRDQHRIGAGPEQSTGEGADDEGRQGRDEDALQAYADARGLSLLDVAIGGLAAKPTVASVIAGATTPE